MCCVVCGLVFLRPFSNHTPNGHVPSGATPQFPWAPLESSHGLQRRHVGCSTSQSRGLIYELVVSVSCEPTDKKHPKKRKGALVWGCRLCGQGAVNVACLCYRLDAINPLMLNCWASIHFLPTMTYDTRMGFLRPLKRRYGCFLWSIATYWASWRRCQLSLIQEL